MAVYTKILTSQSLASNPVNGNYSSWAYRSVKSPSRKKLAQQAEASSSRGLESELNSDDQESKHCFLDSTNKGNDHEKELTKRIRHVLFLAMIMKKNKGIAAIRAENGWFPKTQLKGHGIP
ncbi:hypothetical protein D5086_019991 [Populus alba]|uniref:Uncharacterized protein n=1 Tax=Populus alba TaxID=43335 RepID=A0ACC4BIS7_POPAL